MTVMEALQINEVYDDINQIAQDAAKESIRDGKKSYATRVKEQKKAADALRKALVASFDQYSARMKHGIELLSQAGLLTKIDPTKITTFAANLQSSRLSEASVQDEIGLSDEDMLIIFEHGSEFFERQEYESAADIFLLLTFFNGVVAPFWISLGLAEERKQDFNAAGIAFLMASEVQEEDMSWALRAADCYMKAKNENQAEKILDIIIDEAGHDPKHIAVKQAAQEMKNKRYV